MKCTKCGKTFASHTDGPDICWDCYMKDINSYQATNSPSNCDMPLHKGFGKQEGWICPVCGRGVAPFVDVCPCQSDLKITYGTCLDNVYKICTPDTDTMKFIDEQRNKLYEKLGIPKDLLEG